MLFSLCGDVHGSDDYRHDAIYSRDSSPQSAAPFHSGQDCGFISNLNRIWQVWLLLPDLIQRSGNAAVGSQRNDLKDQGR